MWKWISLGVGGVYPRLLASQRHLSLTSHNLLLFLQPDDVLQEKCDDVLRSVCIDSMTYITVHQGSSTSPLLTFGNGFHHRGLPYILQDALQRPWSLLLDAGSAHPQFWQPKAIFRHCHMSPQYDRNHPQGETTTVEISASLSLFCLPMVALKWKHRLENSSLFLGRRVTWNMRRNRGKTYHLPVFCSHMEIIFGNGVNLTPQWFFLCLQCHLM